MRRSVVCDCCISWSYLQHKNDKTLASKVCQQTLFFISLVDSFHPSQQSFNYVVTGLPGLNQYIKQGLMCLAQGHNTVTLVRLEPTALGSRGKHSTTEPLRSLSADVKETTFVFIDRKMLRHHTSIHCS